MTFDSTLDELLTDTITIEPWVSQDADLKPAFGAAVEYPAHVEMKTKQHIDADGRQFISGVQVLIRERLSIDLRARVTLPSGFVPQQPPLRAIVAHKGLGLDHTLLLFGAGA